MSLDPNAIVLDSIHPAGQRCKANKPRAIIVRFGNIADQQTTWKARPKNKTVRFIIQDLLIPILKFAKLNDAYKDHSYI